MVNQACLRALNAAQDVHGTVDGLAGAATQLDAARWDDVIGRLEQLQARPKENVQACDMSARLPSGVAGSRPPASVTPPASPTS